MNALPRALAPLIAASRERARTLQAQPPFPSPRRGFQKSLKRPDRIAVIAEIKRASPSAGDLKPGADPADLAEAFSASGADALSVLTEPTSFRGSLEDLRAAREACRLPVLRKDFLVDPLQVEEGDADAVLLILRCLGDAEAKALLRRAAELGLDCLVETHSAGEMKRAIALGAGIVGVNARDLDPLQVDLPKALDLLAEAPPSVARVIEDGLQTAEDLRRARQAGADAALIGTALMKSPEPGRALRDMLR